MKLKGLEGMPFKYIITIIVAALVLGAMFLIISNFSATTMQNINTTNRTLVEALNTSLGAALNSTG